MRPHARSAALRLIADSRRKPEIGLKIVNGKAKFYFRLLIIIYHRHGIFPQAASVLVHSTSENERENSNDCIKEERKERNNINYAI